MSNTNCVVVALKAARSVGFRRPAFQHDPAFASVDGGEAEFGALAAAIRKRRHWRIAAGGAAAVVPVVHNGEVSMSSDDRWCEVLNVPRIGQAATGAEMRPRCQGGYGLCGNERCDICCGRPVTANSNQGAGGPVDREALGREAREIYWFGMAGLIDWNDLSDAAREDWRRVGERLFAMGRASTER